MCLANENFILVFDVTFFLTPPDNVLSKIADLSEIESNFLNTPIGGLKLNH